MSERECRGLACSGACGIESAGKKFKLVWHDEFDGTALDTTKWCYRTNFWGRSAPWYAGPEDNAVCIKDGFAHLKIIEKDGQLKSPQLQTGGLLWDIPQERHGIWLFPPREPAKFLKKYGYFECRCRLQKHPGWWSAFWMQAPANGATTDPAISGIEHDMSLTSTRLVGGSANPNAPVQINIVYAKFKQ